MNNKIGVSVVAVLSLVFLASFVSTNKEVSFEGYPRKNIEVEKNFKFSPQQYGTYTELIHGDENKAKEIKLLGLDYVILYTYQTGDQYLQDVYDDICLFGRYGIGVILLLKGDADIVANTALRFSRLKNLIGWYVYDEPTINEKSREMQDEKIKTLKQIRDIPCFTTECGYGEELTQNTLSTLYDYIFSDVYVKKTKLRTDADLLRYYGSIGKIYSYGVDKVLPVYETYWETDSFKDLENNLLMKKNLYGNNKGGVFFIYYTGETVPNANVIYNSNKLKNVVAHIVQQKASDGRIAIKGFCYHDKIHRSNKKFVQFSRRKNMLEDGYLLDGESSFTIAFGKKVSAVRLYYVIDNSNLQVPDVFVNNKKITDINKASGAEGSFILEDIDSKTLSFTSNGNIMFKSLICIGVY